jgi:uncharacterized membrane protein YbhN (UPF0104 family)
VSRRLRRAAAALIATALLALCFRSIDAARLLAVIARAEWAWLLAALAVNATIPLLWAAQWRLFLPNRRRLGFRALYAITAVMAMLANSVPMFLGQVTGVHLLATRGGLGHATALSVVALDQLTEGLCKLAVLSALASITPLPGPLRAAAWALSTGVAVLLAIVLAATWSHGRVRLPAYVRDWAAGLRGVRRPEVVAGGLGIGLAMKCAEMGGILAAQAALEVELPLWSALAVLAAVNLATMVSVAPGNVGVYEGAAYLTYTGLGVAPETAFGLAVLQHAAYLIPMAGSGWITVLVAERRQAAAGPGPGPHAERGEARRGEAPPEPLARPARARL